MPMSIDSPDLEKYPSAASYYDDTKNELIIIFFTFTKEFFVEIVNYFIIPLKLDFTYIGIINSNYEIVYFYTMKQTMYSNAISLKSLLDLNTTNEKFEVKTTN
jgi:hypothetical protein